MQTKISKVWLLALGLSVAICGRAQDKKIDTAQIEQITGLKGKMNTEEGVFKVSSPRADVKVSVDRWEMPPFMGLGTWAACHAFPGSGGNHATCHRHG